MKTFIISLVTSIIVVLIGLLSVPIDVYRGVGTTLTTIQGSDTLSGSRSVINTNFSALNADKLEISDLTASSSLTVGTITSGTWNGTAIGVAYNGTGTTSPTTNQIIFGNGSSGFKVIGFGTSGQFLTSQGAGSEPQWTTSSIDTGANYTWTGLHNFSNATSTLFSAFQAWFGQTATTTIGSDGSITLGGSLDITDQQLVGFASSTEFTADATWTKPSWVTASSTIIIELWGAGGGGGGTAAEGGRWGGSGGGGAYHKFVYLSNELPSSLEIEVGDGGSGGVGANAGSAGGQSCVSTSASCGGTIYAQAYGGGGGGEGSGSNGGGGGGGGVLSVGSTASGSTSGDGGSPAGGNSTEVDSAFGGGRGVGGDSAQGGGGGSTSQSGGDSIYGGGGGATPNANNCVWQSAGTSFFGGDGASGSGTNTNGFNGNAPGGGGTGGCNSIGTNVARNGGDGARGEVRITIYR